MASLPEHLRGTAMGREPVSREVMRAHQRQRVLAAAIPVFAKRGYQATTVDDLLAAGKVGVGNFYSLFEGKEDCFLTGFDQIVGQAREAISEAAPAGQGWAEQTYLGLRSLLATMLAAPLEGRLVLVEAQSAGPEAVSRYNALMDEALAWLSHGREVGGADLPPSYEQAAVSGLAFYLQQCVLDPRSHDVEALLGETSALLLEPVLGQEELARVRRSLGAVRQ
jgi:AcrR family transcriptional regulator